jgi:phage repressor protein C with HTH and peptisase S24 domain/ribosome-binding protein aMBF1 (putative translation factor)
MFPQFQIPSFENPAKAERSEARSPEAPSERRVENCRSESGSTSNSASTGTSRSTSAVATLLQTRRLQLGLSLQRLAEQVHCAKSTLSDIENARRLPPNDLLVRLAAPLQFDEEALLDAARWERALDSGGPIVQEAVSRLRAQSAAASHLASLVKSSPGGLDAAYRSGELALLIARMTGRPPERTAPDFAESTDQIEGAVRKDTGNQRGEAGDTPASLTPILLAREVPLINKVAAGYPREFTDLAYPARIADEYVRCPDIADPDAFAARVVGDSMEPDYREGDIVVFSPLKPVKSGDDCFARLERDSETTFKRIYFENAPDGADLIRLQPINNKYGPRLLAREEVAGLYTAVTWIRRIG